ncbi:hypothetical protein AVEN_8351-1 [Araneus ventricosus]|uniref:Uncharacterized protein n=1 Tax=Araneus ventricosus TaxID=182803 RepID=A0A4Y2QH43_ARAVE|nr:hypothetical protein AVEN_8351-1 [Araneus ventricosus]
MSHLFYHVYIHRTNKQTDTLPFEGFTRRTGSTSALPKHPGHLNGSRCNSSSTQAGVLVAHQRAAARPLSMEVRTIPGIGTQSPTITIPTGEFPLTYPAATIVCDLLPACIANLCKCCVFPVSCASRFRYIRE